MALGDRTVTLYAGYEFAGDNVQECIRKRNTFFRGIAVAGNVNMADPKQLIAPSLEKTRALADTLGVMLPLAEWGVGHRLSNAVGCC